ncbi:Uncharacterised protein [Mycobacterium tuberculosis]|uniref:Uncharacterized protein n=1 Tax=Mycobacterium tuberculosis TaxID=1773 RepID=A0A654ZK68_MYCTX|nr:Uncharacterised protein [Mycobacterium tuberculosis]COZ81495.1 Uncharacterised protein [Mycobacterium tuberculosis]
MYGKAQIVRTAVRGGDMNGSQRRVRIRLILKEFGQDAQDRGPFLGAACSHAVGHRPVGKPGEFCGCRDVLLPYPIVADQVQAQCVVVVDHCGQHRSNIR